MSECLTEKQADKVSVIIPAYNAEKFIERAIMSVVHQDYADVEIIVVNDGSEDSTEQIVKKLCVRYPNIRLYNTENFGVSHARNVGLDHAAGEFVTFLDADDVLLNHSLQDLLICAKQNNLDIVAAKFHSVCEGEEVDKLPDDNGGLVVYRGKKGLLRAIEDQPETYSACAKLYRYSAVASVRFPEGKKVHEDSFFCFMCLTQEISFGVYNKTVYRCYMTPNSASRGGFSEKIFDILELAEKKRCIIAEQFPELLKSTRLMMVKANMALLQCMLKTKEKKYRHIEKKAINFIVANKDCFKAAIPTDKVVFWIIKNHLYGLYKLIYRLKNGL